MDINPFRFETRIDVVAAPKGAALALDVFGPHAASLPPGIVSLAPAKTFGGAKGEKAGKTEKACTPADEAAVATALEAVQGAIDAATPSASGLVRAFLADANAFATQAKLPSLPANACPALCKAATQLAAGRDLGDPEKAKARYQDQKDRMTATLMIADAVAKDLTCRKVLDEKQGKLRGLSTTAELDWPKVEAALLEAQPQLAHLHRAVTSGLGPSAANQVFRDQPLPAEASTVTVRITRTDLWAEAPADPIVTSAEATVGRSRYSFSLGLGLMGLPERRAVRVPSKGTGTAVVSNFGYDVASRFSPTVVGLLNATVLEGDCRKIGLCGLAVSAGLQPASDPKKLRYLAAASFSALDGSLLASFGAAVGQVEVLAGGFEVGAPVPNDLLEVPVRQDWKVGWFAALTYRVR